MTLLYVSVSVIAVAYGFGGAYNEDNQCSALAAVGTGSGANWQEAMPQEAPTCETDRISPSPDGSCSCTFSDTLGMAGSSYDRILPASFPEKELPNARALSNAFWSRKPKHQDQQNMMVLALIQFGVHDFSDSRTTDDLPPYSIPAPIDDPVLKPGESLQLKPSVINKPDYTIPNYGSHWLDTGGLYGNDLETQKKLREPGSAKMKTDASGLLLPSEEETGVVMEAPWCTRKKNSPLFAAGGRLANMNHLMLLMHTLFMRNHNSWVDTLLEWAPTLADWSTDDLFGLVRHINTMQLEVVVGQYLDSYLGGQSELKEKMVEGLLKVLDHCNANIKCAAPIEFSMVYRWHDFIVDELKTGDTTINFVDTAYDPDKFREPGYVDTLVRAALNTKMTRSGSGVIDSLRTMKHGGSVFDLAAAGIARSRERGIPSYTAYRECFGYDPINSFEEMSNIPEVVANLKALYESPSDVDLLVGVEVESYEENFPHPPYIALLLSLPPLKKLGVHSKFSVPNVMKKTYPNQLIHYTEGIDTDSGDLFSRIMDVVRATTVKDLLVGNTDVGADEIPDEALLIPTTEPVPSKLSMRVPPWLVSQFGDEFGSPPLTDYKMPM